jgi:hypothetical protein
MLLALTEKREKPRNTTLVIRLVAKREGDFHK